MGDTLSRPITDKHSERHEGPRVKCGASGMQGWRRGMEDAHTTIVDLQATGGPEGSSFFAVFDGHCGPNIARYCGENVHKKLLGTEEFQTGQYVSALRCAFLGVDSDLVNNPVYKNDGSGCTAVAALITDKQVLCANAGDSRCVLCSDGKAIPLSSDHKPTNETELKRIQRAGSFVSSGRVNGNLALSRAIGDFDFKQNKSLPAEEQAISANPDIMIHDLCPEDEFLVLACDGIWDVMTNEEVISFVRSQLQSEGTGNLAGICEKVFDKCLAPSAPGLGCDNMTMIVVLLTQNWEQRHGGS